MNDKQRDALLQDADFVALARQKGMVSLALPLLALAAYFGFMALLAFGRDVLARRVAGDINLGIPLGIGVIVLCWILTGVYVLWANSKYDAMVARVQAKAGTQAGPQDEQKN